MSKLLDYPGLQHYHEKVGLKVAEHFTCEVALAGAGNTNVASADLTSFVPGHKYRAVLDWNKSAVTSANTYDGFTIGSYDSSSTRTYLVHIMAQQVLESYYDIIIPANSVRLKVSGRANSGTTAKVRFYDLTPVLNKTKHSSQKRYSMVSRTIPQRECHSKLMELPLPVSRQIYPHLYPFTSMMP